MNNAHRRRHLKRRTPDIPAWGELVKLTATEARQLAERLGLDVPEGAGHMEVKAAIHEARQ